MHTNSLQLRINDDIIYTYYMYMRRICFYLRNMLVDKKTSVCTFAGHSRLFDAENIYNSILCVIEELIKFENVYEFRVGNYGEFDRLSARAVRLLKKKYPNIQLNLVVPYLTSEINKYKEDYYKEYDNILIADMPENTPRKLKIIKSNRYMIESSDFLICYVKHSWGGAAITLEYAKKTENIKIINLAESTIINR